MRLKSELYKKEQNKIINQVCILLDLDNKDTITLYELDDDIELQNKIMDLLPNIRKYFSFTNIEGARNPEKRKRPWLSILKYMIRKRYKIENKDYRLYNETGAIRTMRYTFTKL